MWECKCDCGNIVFTSTNSLKRNNTKSCGCLQKEKAAASGRSSSTTHGLSRDEKGKKTRLYRIWTGIKTRCFNPNVKEFSRYGGRGITLCEEWKDFKVFHDWAVANGYQDDLSIDRQNLDGNYQPDNCKWVTDKVQCINRSTSKFIEYKGELKTLSALAEEYSMSINCLYERLKRGWNIEKALTTIVS